VPFRDKLNPQQRDAVETTEGPLLILAGAGSGKTRVITFRVAHMVENLGVEPDSILAVTFTNKAAAEMAERIGSMIRATFAKPVISTFHSFCVRLLRRDVEKLQVNGQGLTRQFVIYDDKDQESLVKSAMKRLGMDDKQLKPSAVLSRISYAKNHMMDPEDYYLNSSDPQGEKIAHVFKMYRQELRKANAMDFDDLLLEAVRLLKEVPDVRVYYNRRFRYILVDEYQDTNRPQYELMRMLAGERHNVCAVGDEDQSIYSWRGADIRNILEFERDFPNAKIIRLEQNYRSTQNILQAASAVVANNQKRKGKNLWTSRTGGPKVGYYEAPDGENEALFAADYMDKYLRDNREAKAAILYRTNSQSRLFEEALRRYQLQYHVVGGFSFYERAEIKDMISYLKVVQNPDDTIAMQRVINTPPRGIGKSSMEVIERVALETGTSVWRAVREVVEKQLLPARAVGALKTFQEIIEDAQAMLAGTYGNRLTEQIAVPKKQTPKLVENDDVSFDFGAASFDFGANFEAPTRSELQDPEMGEADSEDADAKDASFSPGDFSDADDPLGEASTDHAPTGETVSAQGSTADILKYIIDRTRYIKLLEAEDTPESLARVENLRELVNAAMDSRDRGESLGEFLDHAALVSDADQFDEKARITLMTLHAAKGLEFPLVFLVGMEEGLFPHSRTFYNPDEIEEERRLCYVGMTRAMDALVLSRARYRRRYGTEMPEASVASRFLEEIPPDLVQDLGTPGASRSTTSRSEYPDFGEKHYSYEDEDQRPTYSRSGVPRSGSRPPVKYSGPSYNSIDNIAEFFASRGKKFTKPKVAVEAPSGSRGFRPGQKVRHPKYGEGTVFKREGDGDDAKITVQFRSFGLKKLVEKYAQLEKA
jgi:DNA helicase II / ATP-dependent DNA helicase PcrA